jgi:hypothetical protein
MTGADVSGEARKGFFFEKKKQKTFLNWVLGVGAATDSEDRSFFCFFFVHKKEDFFLPCDVVLGHAR